MTARGRPGTAGDRRIDDGDGFARPCRPIGVTMAPLAAKRLPAATKDDREIGRAIIARALGRAPSVRRRSHQDRFANIALGALFFFVGMAPLVAFLWFALRNHSEPGALWMAVSICVLFSTIGLLGVSMMIQGARNRPGVGGFFYRGLFWVGKRVTPVHAALTPLALCLLVVMRAVATQDLGALRSSLLAVLVWSSIFAQLFLHEVGHLVAVRRARLPFVRLAAGPVTLLPNGRSYRFGANRRWIHFVMGAVYYELRDTPSARQTLLVAAAGPIATACLGLLSIAVRSAYASEAGSLVHEVASANAFVAVGTLFTNLLPVRLGRTETDGLQIWRALRSLSGRAG
jgi:hypothetical protein